MGIKLPKVKLPKLPKVDLKKAGKSLAGQVAIGLAFDQLLQLLGWGQEDLETALAQGEVDLVEDDDDSDDDDEESVGFRIRIRTPRIRLPKIRLPKVRLPKINVPKVKLPKFKFPKIDFKKAGKSLAGNIAFSIAFDQLLQQLGWGGEELESALAQADMDVEEDD